MSAYLIHWTSTRPEELADRPPGATAVMSVHRAESLAELEGFLLGLPGDGSFVVRAVSVLDE